MIRLRVFPGNQVKAELAATAPDSMTDGDFDRVRKAVRSLPAKYREPVVLKYLEELSTEKICEILGLSSNAVYVRLNRGREMLKEKLLRIRNVSGL
jgi:RNA polymerase sigma factor (sigma-70 family)